MSEDKFLDESNEFWKDIIYKDGVIDEEQVAKELCDWLYVMRQLPLIYDEITGGMLSKVMYSAGTVLQLARENYNKQSKEDIKEALEAFVDGEYEADDIEQFLKEWC